MQSDIIKKINNDFSNPVKVIELLEEMEKVEGSQIADRIYRSIIFLAEGKIEKLKHYINLFFKDYRDLLWYAEYEGKDPEVQKYDFNQSFVELGLL